MDYLAQEQTQPRRSVGHARPGPVAGETAGQQPQLELLVGVGDKAVQVVQLGVSHRPGAPAAAAVRR